LGDYIVEEHAKLRGLIEALEAVNVVPVATVEVKAAAPVAKKPTRTKTSATSKAMPRRRAPSAISTPRKRAVKNSGVRKESASAR
jgi:hypothetical protein